MDDRNYRDVRVYDTANCTECTQKIAIDPTSFPEDKYCESGCFYAIRYTVNGRPALVICTAAEWRASVAKTQKIRNKYSADGKGKKRIGIIIAIIIAALLIAGAIAFFAIRYFGAEEAAEAPVNEKEETILAEMEETEPVPGNGTFFGQTSPDMTNSCKVLFKAPADSYYEYYVFAVTSRTDPKKSFELFVYRSRNKVFYLEYGEYDIVCYGGNDWYGHKKHFLNDLKKEVTMKAEQWFEYTVTVSSTEDALNVDVEESKTPLYGLVEETMPEHGTVLYDPENKEGNSVFSVDTSGGDPGIYYYITLENQAGELVQSAFMSANATLEIVVPTGLYKVKYAGGTTWYGYEKTFGPYGAYLEEEELIEFTAAYGRTKKLSFRQGE